MDSSEGSIVDKLMEDMMLEHVSLFSESMLQTESDPSNNESGDLSFDDQDIFEETEDVLMAAEDDVPPPPITKGQGNHAELMTHFRSILSVCSADDLPSKVLQAMSCIESGKAGNGSVSFARKAKSLVQRWLAKSVDTITLSTGPDTLDVKNDIIIERNTIVILTVKFGQGATAADVSCHFRVMEVYAKYYNKWFMSKPSFKKWNNEAKPYKVKVRMMEKNALNEYYDVDLVGDMAYDRKDICKVVDDSMIVGVVGKLDHLVV